MKIECPNCKLTGQTSDVNIPPEGRYMDCPRCKTNFFIQKTAVANWADTLTDCPECGYSSFSAERFDICPHCGLVAKTYNEQHKQQPGKKAALPAEEPVVVDRERMRQELERLEREETKKRRLRAESAAAPLPAAMPPEEPLQEELVVPAPVRYLGWGFVVAGLIVLVYGIKGWYGYWIVTPEQAVTTQFEDIPGPFKLFMTFGFPPMVQILLGICAVVTASQFLKMRPGARKWLETAAWGGIVYVIGNETANLVAAIRRSSSEASFFYYLVEAVGFVMMSTLWSAPLVAAIWYMRTDVIMDEFEG